MRRPIFDPKRIAAFKATRFDWDAWDALMNPRFRDSWRQLAAGDERYADIIVQFLEEDPYFFRTGYWKAEFIGLLNKVELDRKLRARLGLVCLMVVDKCDRREFRSYCKLAKHNDSPALRAGLAERERSDDSGIRRRAAWMIEALNQPRPTSPTPSKMP